MPVIFTAFGVLVWGMAMLAESKGKVATWKWLGIGLLIIGMVFGFQYFEKMIGGSPDDTLYRANLPSNRRFQFAHYGAFLLPVLATVLCFLWQFSTRKPAPADTPTTE